MFGEVALIDDTPRRDSAVAREDCAILAITRDQVNERVAAIDPLLRLCLGAIVARGSAAIEQARSLATGLPGQPPQVLPIWIAQAASARETLSFEHQLRLGIERGELGVHFQPIVHLASGRIAGFEALVRWQHPERGLLLPNSFIPHAEATGTITSITTMCLRQVGECLPTLRAAAARNAAVFDRPFVSVNISGLDLAQSAFAATTVSILWDAGAEPEDVRLEVTESILMKDAERCARTLENCRDQGLVIAIDDFGTGYSSLHTLNTLPISILKMDQSFCRSLLADAAGRKIIGAILQLGRELGLSVIAEGVELTSQSDVLQAMGCGFGQGYLFGAAVGLTETVKLILGWQARAAAVPVAVAPAA